MSETADTPVGGERRGLSRFLKPLIVASLALNVLILGALGSSVWMTKRHGGGYDGAHGRGEIGIKSFLRQLPPERRKELGGLLPKKRGEFMPLRQSVVTARQAAAERLAAEPFDADALRHAFGEIDTAEAALRGAAREAIIKTVGSMTADERRQLSAWWQKKRASLFQMPTERESRRRARQDETGKSQPEPAP